MKQAELEAIIKGITAATRKFIDAELEALNDDLTERLKRAEARIEELETLALERMDEAA